MKKVVLLAGLVLAGFIAMKASLAGEAKNAGQVIYDSTGRPMSIRDASGRAVHLVYCNDDRSRPCDVRWTAP